MKKYGFFYYAPIVETGADAEFLEKYGLPGAGLLMRLRALAAELNHCGHFIDRNNQALSPDDIASRCNHSAVKGKKDAKKLVDAALDMGVLQRGFNGVIFFPSWIDFQPMDYLKKQADDFDSFKFLEDMEWDKYQRRKKNSKNYEEIAWRSLFRCKIIGEKNGLDFNPIQWDDWWARNAKNFESPIAYADVIKVFYNGIRPKFTPIENGIDIDF